VHCTKISPEFKFGGHSPRRSAQPPKMWRFCRESTQNVNKAMRSDETSHRTHSAHRTCVRLRCWENQRRLCSFYVCCRYIPTRVSSSCMGQVRSQFCRRICQRSSSMETLLHCCLTNWLIALSIQTVMTSMNSSLLIIISIALTQFRSAGASVPGTSSKLGE